MRVVEFNKKYEDVEDGAFYVFRNENGKIIEDCYDEDELFNTRVIKQVYMMNEKKAVIFGNITVGEIVEYSPTSEEKCSLPLLKEAEKEFFFNFIK